MLRGKLALASVFLCFVCVFAQRPRKVDKRCSLDSLRMVQTFINESHRLKCLDCRLYTPTINDYQQKCPSSTLKCFADEVNVLKEEWENVKGLSRLNMNLQTLAMFFNQTGSECLQCELLKEETAEQFLKDLKNTIEMMNSQFCSP